MKIMALPVKQPWSWLIVNGYKDVENRNNPPASTRIGNRFAIYASKGKVTKTDYEYFLEDVKNRKIKNYPKSIEEFDYGCIVGTVLLKGFSRNSKSYWAAKGSCHWLLSGVKKMKPKKIPRGFQFWFSVNI